MQNQTDLYLDKSGLSFPGCRETEGSLCEQSSWTLEKCLLKSITRDEVKSTFYEVKPKRT